MGVEVEEHLKGEWAPQLQFPNIEAAGVFESE
jgi:hypothetical protein